MGHVARMEGERLAIQTMGWSPEGKCRPRNNGQETIREDIRYIDMLWREAIDMAEDREGWRDCVARCADLHRKD